MCANPVGRTGTLPGPPVRTTLCSLPRLSPRRLAEPDNQTLSSELLEVRPDFAVLWGRQDVRGRME
jgi:hypothetical protein